MAWNDKYQTQLSARQLEVLEGMTIGLEYSYKDFYCHPNVFRSLVNKGFLKQTNQGLAPSFKDFAKFTRIK